MNVWITRGLFTAGITGGLILGGAVAANAATASPIGLDKLGASQQQSDHTGGATASAPISLGGAHLGATTNSGSTSTSSATHTSKGKKTTVTAYRASSSSQQLGLNVRPITIDPAAIAGAHSQYQQMQGGRHSAVAGSSESTVAGQAPISIGGLDLTDTTQNSSSSGDSRQSTDRRGDTQTSTSRQTSANSSSYGLGLAPITADPSGVVTNASDFAASQHGRHSSATGTSSTDGEFSSPLSIGGLTTAARQTSANTSDRSESYVGRHSTSATSEHNENASDTAAGFGIGS
ncbi:hypothetical protein [Fodinicola feengrottensis]|uniref:hypothetical protein n=1 Tax=Fodinicola feengrottensis TaxID=435914 RepID=UPI0013D1CEA2|nr:hypothetical protein [Fodinicola feengrottensis]